MSEHFQQLGNIGAGAALAVVVTFMTLFENIEKINNRNMKFSIVGCMASFMVSMCFVSTSWRALPDDPDKFVNLIIMATVFYDLSFTTLTYHSAYRTILICKPFSPRVTLYAAGIALTQVLCHGTASYFWATNMMKGKGTTVSPISQKMELVVLVYYSIVETVLFIVTQYRIIEAKAAMLAKGAGGGGHWRVKAYLYGKGLMRSLAYTINITLGFIALGNALPQAHLTNSEAWNFPMYGPVFCMIVMLTDVGRFQSTIATLTKASQHERSSSNDASQIRGAANTKKSSPVVNAQYYGMTYSEAKTEFPVTHSVA